MFKTQSGQWIVCQIGAREHYAIPRALHAEGRLAALITDFWCPPGSLLSKLPSGKGLRDRWHADLAAANVIAPNWSMLAFEIWARARKVPVWPRIITRNRWFQQKAIRALRSQRFPVGQVTSLFSYSYAADELFQYARQQGWKTVLDQIDPGPEEERIVGQEHQRYPTLGSRWKPAPDGYWSNWRKEVDQADRIIINSDWSRRCLLKEGIEADKLDEIPLVYDRPPLKTIPITPMDSPATPQSSTERLKVLFLGQINLRKGIGRLLDAMRLLKDQPIDLILAGPSEVPESAWSDLPNVRWIGLVPRSEVGQVYQSSDLFILPTLSDGYAITQLEALAYELPVMRSTRSGDPFVTCDEELTLNDLEPESIRDALLRASRSNVTRGKTTKSPPVFHGRSGKKPAGYRKNRTNQ